MMLSSAPPSISQTSMVLSSASPSSLSQPPCSPTSSPSSGGLKRRSLSKACAICHHSKVHCDGNRPCERCKRLKRADECVDRVPRKRGRPSHKPAISSVLKHPIGGESSKVLPQATAKATKLTTPVTASPAKPKPAETRKTTTSADYYTHVTPAAPVQVSHPLPQSQPQLPLPPPPQPQAQQLNPIPQHPVNLPPNRPHITHIPSQTQLSQQQQQQQQQHPQHQQQQQQQPHKENNREDYVSLAVNVISSRLARVSKYFMSTTNDVPSAAAMKRMRLLVTLLRSWLNESEWAQLASGPLALWAHVLPYKLKQRTEGESGLTHFLEDMPVSVVHFQYRYFNSHDEQHKDNTHKADGSNGEPKDSTKSNASNNNEVDSVEILMQKNWETEHLFGFANEDLFKNCLTGQDCGATIVHRDYWEQCISVGLDAIFGIQTDWHHAIKCCTKWGTVIPCIESGRLVFSDDDSRLVSLIYTYTPITSHPLSTRLPYGLNTITSCPRIFSGTLASFSSLANPSHHQQSNPSGQGASSQPASSDSVGSSANYVGLPLSPALPRSISSTTSIKNLLSSIPYETQGAHGQLEHNQGSMMGPLGNLVGDENLEGIHGMCGSSSQDDEEQLLSDMDWFSEFLLNSMPTVAIDG